MTATRLASGAMAATGATFFTAASCSTSETNRFRCLMLIGSSSLPRRQANSQKRTHTRPQTDASGFFSWITESDSV